MGSNDPTTLRVMAAVFFVGFLWVAGSTVRVAFDKALLMNGRIGTAATSVFFLAIAIPAAGLAATGRVPSLGRTGTYVTLLTACLIGFVSSAYRVREWFDRYKTFMCEEIEVPRRGFSWRLLGAWALWIILFLVLEAIPATARNDAVQLAGVFIVFSTVPILTITVRFVRRANAHFERHKTVDWSDYLNDDTSSDAERASDADPIPTMYDGAEQIGLHR